MSFLDQGSSSLQSVADDDIKATREREAVQQLELKKKQLEIEINQLETDIASISSDSFTRDQLPSVKSEIEENCNELFATRTNALVQKIQQAKSERQILEGKLESLKKTLQTEQQLTRQFIEGHNQNISDFEFELPDIVIPDLTTLKQSYCAAHRKRLIEEETREAEQTLAARKHALVESENRLQQMYQESKATAEQLKAQIRTESLEAARLEEERTALLDRLEAAKLKKQQLEAEAKKLAAKKEAIEAANRSKLDELNRRYVAQQREFEQTKARKLAELRELQKMLKENEELNKAKNAEKLSLQQSIEETTANRMQRAQSQSVTRLKAEIAELEQEKTTIIKKHQDLVRKMASNEKKLEAVKSKIERKIAANEQRLRLV